jgi:hypothetical protein
VTAPEPQTGGKAFGTLANEFANMVIAYAKQETVVPIKQLGRYVLFGIVGALLLGIGGGLLALAAIRAVQAETGAHLRGSFTWVPYFGGVVVAGLGAAWAASRITKGSVPK